MMFAALQAQEYIFSFITLLLSGGFVTALVVAFKARPERDSVIITNTQNAAEMLRGTNEALYADWEREHARRIAAEEELARLRIDIEVLRGRLKDAL